MLNNTISTDLQDRWEILVEEFRAFVGTADNVIRGEVLFGLGLFPKYPAKPVKLLDRKNTYRGRQCGTKEWQNCTQRRKQLPQRF